MPDGVLGEGRLVRWHADRAGGGLPARCSSCCRWPPSSPKRCGAGRQPSSPRFDDPDTQAAIRLTLLVAAIAVPLNLVFGLSAAWAIAKFEFPRQERC